MPIRGFGHNEELIGRALAGRRDEVVLATKFAAKVNPDRAGIAIDGRPEYVRAACEASLKRLQTDVIDLYYYHRLDPSVPVEDTVGAMGQLVDYGNAASRTASHRPVANSGSRWSPTVRWADPH